MKQDVADALIEAYTEAIRLEYMCGRDHPVYPVFKKPVQTIRENLLLVLASMLDGTMAETQPIYVPVPTHPQASPRETYPKVTWSGTGTGWVQDCKEGSAE